MDTSGDGYIGPPELSQAFDTFFYSATGNKDSKG